MRSHERSSPNLEVRHGRRQQALVMPGRHDVTIGSGGEKFNAKPAQASHIHSVSRQRHASSRNEAGHIAKAKLDGFTTTIPVAMKRDASANNNAVDPSAANASSHSPESEQRQSKPGDQSALAGAQQNATTHQPRRAAPPTQTPRSETQQAEQRISKVRCGASGWHKHTEQAHLSGPSSQYALRRHIKKRCRDSHEQRNPPRWQGARPVRLPKTQWPTALHAIKSQVLQRKLAVRAPLRNNLGPTHQVTGIRKTTSRQQTPSH